MEKIIFANLADQVNLSPPIQTPSNASDLFLLNSCTQDLITVSIKSESYSTCDNNNKVHVSVLSFDDAGSPYLLKESHGRAVGQDVRKSEESGIEISKSNESPSLILANDEVFESIEAVIRRDICQMLSAASKSDWLINLKYLQRGKVNIRESENGHIIISGSLQDITHSQKIITGYIKDHEKLKNETEYYTSSVQDDNQEECNIAGIDFNKLTNLKISDKLCNELEKFNESDTCEFDSKDLFHSKQKDILNESITKNGIVRRFATNISAGDSKKDQCRCPNGKITDEKLFKKNLNSYKCSQCSYVTHCLSSLNFHKKMHRRSTKAALLNGRCDLSTKNSQVLSSCDACGIEMENRKFKIHMSKFHPIKHECTQCSYSTLSKVHFIRHQKTIHENQRPHECEICGKSFKRQDHMKLHQVIHYRDQKEFLPPPKSIFKCEICKKIVRSAAYLKEHMLTHSPSRSFLCEICGSAFKTRATHRGHIRTMHSSNLQHNPCPKCGKQFSSMASLKRHMFQHQKRSNFAVVEELGVGCANSSIPQEIENHGGNEKGWNNFLPDMNFLAPVNQISAVDENLQSNDTASIESSADSQAFFQRC